MASRKRRSVSYPVKFWVAVTAALLGAFQFGYQTAILNTAQDTVMEDIGFDNRAVVTSMVVVGAMVGAISAGSIADMIGPKKAQLLNVLPFTLGAALAAFSPCKHWFSFLAGRFISGIGAGAGSLYVPRYLSEISPPSLRGNLVTQNQVLINAGLLVSYLIGMPYDSAISWSNWHLWESEIEWWRIMLCFSFLPAIVQIALLLSVPESPVWLEGHDRDEADEACIALWGCEAIAPQLHMDEADLSTEVLSTEEEEQRTRKEGWLALFKREYRWMMALAIGAPLLQQASGINTVIYYSSDVFKLAQLGSPVLGSVLMGLVNLGFTLVAGALMDRRGRRPLLLFSYIGMAISLATFTLIYNSTWIEGQLQGVVMCFMILVYVMFFALGVGPIPWLYMSEILPDRIKGRAASIATFLAWGANLMVTSSFDHMIQNLGLGNAYLVYALGNLGGAMFTYFLVVETKCFTLAAIERMLLLPSALSTSMETEDTTVPLLAQLPPPATVFPRSHQNHQEANGFHPSVWKLEPQSKVDAYIPPLRESLPALDEEFEEAIVFEDKEEAIGKEEKQ